MEIPKPSLTRLARRAGVKSLSKDCYPYIRTLIRKKLQFTIEKILAVNSVRQTKTIMVEDVYTSLELQGKFMTASENLSTTTLASLGGSTVKCNHRSAFLQGKI